MLCKIADLFVEVPAVGGMDSRCWEYLYPEKVDADIIIYDDLYRPDTKPHLSANDVAYVDSGAQFYRQLLDFDGLLLHASAVEMDGRAYLFSGPCGMGKSTHTRLWQQVFGSAAQVFNDDKPALRRMEDRWFAYGTPWSGKHGINQNKKVPLAGICFLKRGEENQIRRLRNKEAVSQVIRQTMHRFRDVERLDLLLGHVEKLVQEVPVYELRCRPDEAAADLSYRTMSRDAKEVGL